MAGEQDAKITLAEQLTPPTPGETDEQRDYRIAQTANELVFDASGNIVWGITGMSFAPVPQPGGGIAYVRAGEESAPSKVFTDAGLPPGYTQDLATGEMFRTVNGKKVLVDTDEVNAAIQAARAAGRTPPAPPPIQAIQSGKTGTMWLYNPASGQFTDTGKQIDWPTIDPKLTFDEQVRQFNKSLAQNADLAREGHANDLLLANTGNKAAMERLDKQLAEQRYGTDKQIAEQRFATNAQLAPQLANLGMEASDRIRDIISSGEDVGFRLWNQRGEDAPFDRLTPSTQINQVLDALKQVSGFLNDAQGAAGPTAAPPQAEPPTAAPPAGDGAIRPGDSDALARLVALGADPAAAAALLGTTSTTPWQSSNPYVAPAAAPVPAGGGGGGPASFAPVAAARGNFGSDPSMEAVLEAMGGPSAALPASTPRAARAADPWATSVLDAYLAERGSISAGTPVTPQRSTMTDEEALRRRQAGLNFAPSPGGGMGVTPVGVLARWGAGQ